jgi:hypothetical protein
MDHNVLIILIVVKINVEMFVVLMDQDFHWNLYPMELFDRFVSKNFQLIYNFDVSVKETFLI